MVRGDFGLGFELVDEKGRSVPGSFQDVAAFPHLDLSICLPFAIAGDFVYHCHIQEHEDGGMMATIHVAGSGDSRTNPAGSGHPMRNRRH